jgi:hypothetical protein
MWEVKNGMGKRSAWVVCNVLYNIATTDYNR